MKTYYRIQKREFSSNIIEKGIEGSNKKITWNPYLAPLCKKSEGDIICQNMLKYLHINF